uniref:Polyprotein n=1 Tax=Cannabis sativa TaxID=3483 RepID=A0A803NFV4_CANSA
MKDLGSAKKILGIDIQRPSSNVIIPSQESYLQKVLNKFGMDISKVVSTPLAQHFKLKFVANPGNVHWTALKWVIRYIKGTLNTGLTYDGSRKFEELVTGYVDSDYAGCLDIRKLFTGFVFTVYEGCASWKSNLQKVVALYFTEVEYMATTKAIKEAIWLKELTCELNINSDDVTVHCDNESALHLMKNLMFHEMTKHIDIKMYFIRDVIQSKIVSVRKINTQENYANFFTKSLTEDKFRLCLDLLNINSNKSLN